MPTRNFFSNHGICSSVNYHETKFKWYNVKFGKASLFKFALIEYEIINLFLWWLIIFLFKFFSQNFESCKLWFCSSSYFEKNYFSRVLHVEIHLDANDLGNVIKEGNTESNQVKFKIMIFLRYPLQEWIKTEYLTIKDQLDLWNNLREVWL